MKEIRWQSKQISTWSINHTIHSGGEKLGSKLIHSTPPQIYIYLRQFFNKNGTTLFCWLIQMICAQLLCDLLPLVLAKKQNLQRECKIARTSGNKFHARRQKVDTILRLQPFIFRSLPPTEKVETLLKFFPYHFYHSSYAFINISTTPLLEKKLVWQ